MDTNKSFTNPKVNNMNFGFLNLTSHGIVSIQKIKDLDFLNRRRIKKQEKNLKRMDLVLSDEAIVGVRKEIGLEDDLIKVLEKLVTSIDRNAIVEIYSRKTYEKIKKIITNGGLTTNYRLKHEARIQTKYKNMTRKIKPIAIKLPIDTIEHIKQVIKEPNLRERHRIGQQFI